MNVINQTPRIKHQPKQLEGKGEKYGLLDSDEVGNDYCSSFNPACIVEGCRYNRLGYKEYCNNNQITIPWFVL